MTHALVAGLMLAAAYRCVPVAAHLVWSAYAIRLTLKRGVLPDEGAAMMIRGAERHAEVWPRWAQRHGSRSEQRCPLMRPIWVVLGFVDAHLFGVWPWLWPLWIRADWTLSTRVLSREIDNRWRPPTRAVRRAPSSPEASTSANFVVEAVGTSALGAFAAGRVAAALPPLDDAGASLRLVHVDGRSWKVRAVDWKRHPEGGDTAPGLGDRIEVLLPVGGLPDPGEALTLELDMRRITGPVRVLASPP